MQNRSLFTGKGRSIRGVCLLSKPCFKARGTKACTGITLKKRGRNGGERSKQSGLMAGKGLQGNTVKSFIRGFNNLKIRGVARGGGCGRRRYLGTRRGGPVSWNTGSGGSYHGDTGGLRVLENGIRGRAGGREMKRTGITGPGSPVIQKKFCTHALKTEDVLHPPRIK